MQQRHLLVPNLFNLPFTLFGWSVNKKMLGLAIYTSSRAANCAYCSAHTCSFALRRGISIKELVGDRSPRATAVVNVAEGLSKIPANLTIDQCTELTKYFSPADIKWLVLSIGMMGFLNKFMDAIGVELEASALEDVSALLTPTGWKPGQHITTKFYAVGSTALPPIDSLGTYFRVIKQLPAAIQLEGRWINGVPDRWPAAGDFLEKHTGYRFPILGRFTHPRVIRSLTTVLRDNLDPTHSSLGLTAKCLVGLVYATVVNNPELATAARQLAARLAPHLDENTWAAVTKFANQPLATERDSLAQAKTELSALPTLTEQDVAAILLARAAAPSPAAINATIRSEVTATLTHPSIVEVIVWLSVQQLLHRLSWFYQVAAVTLEPLR